MKKLIIVLIVASVIFSYTRLTQAIPPLCVQCTPEIAFQSRLLCLPLFMLIISCDFDAEFDQTSEVKILSDEIIKFGQFYINEKTILTFALILPAGLEAAPNEGKIIPLEVNTVKGYDVMTSLLLII
jgi:hypothetical protein